MDILRSAAAFASESAAFRTALTLLEARAERLPNRLRVLTYHRVDWPERRPELLPSLISASPESFEQQMRLVAERYSPVSMHHALDALRNGQELPPHAVTVTFDDAYVDFAENAWPIMQRFGIPATLFVPTDYPSKPDRAFWWDRVHAAVERSAAIQTLLTPLGRTRVATQGQRKAAITKLLLYIKSLDHGHGMAVVDTLCADAGEIAVTNHVLDWASLRRLASEGVTLAAHTRSHPLLTRVSADEIRREVEGSLVDLRREIGEVLPVFAYPAGAVNERVKQVLRDSEITLAFSTSAGANLAGEADLLDLRRIHVGRRTTVPILRLKTVLAALEQPGKPTQMPAHPSTELSQPNGREGRGAAVHGRQGRQA